MKKTSEQFIDMREKEYLISATFKVEGHLVNPMENYLMETTNRVSYKILADTEELYQNDRIFRELVKMESEARKQKEIYINNKL